MEPVVVRLPKLGLTMEEGHLLEWCVEPNEVVTTGQELAVVETDKVEVGIESPCDGTVKEIYVAAKTDCLVGTPLCSIEPAQ